MQARLCIAGAIALSALSPGTAAPVQPYQIAKRMILDRMLDPSSTQFRGLRTKTASVEGSTQTLVCGEYNSKNRMGGYVGFKAFAYSPRRQAVITGDGDIYNQNGPDQRADTLSQPKKLAADADLNAIMNSFTEGVEATSAHFALANSYLRACQ